jgi:hypothetical protein
VTTVPVYCEASFNYASAEGLVTVVQPVHDGRQTTADALPFEECGFRLIAHESAVSDWTDEAEVDGVGREEFGELARSFTGCDAVVVYPTILRNPVAAERVTDYAPILFVHSDYTDDFGPMVTDANRPYQEFLRRGLECSELTQEDLRSATRLMMLQLWRNVGPARPDHPLAFCDARDVVDGDRRVPFLIPEYGGQRAEFEAFAFTPPPPGRVDHWYTYPSMSADEAVLLRTYDSACAHDGRPFWTPHSAFRDPAVGAEPANRRASVEMRAICVWR